MHYTPKTRLLAMLLAVVMIVGLLPMSVLATGNDSAAVAADAGDFGAPKIVYTPHDDYYNVISKTDYVLAPGITESEIVLNSDGGAHRQVAHVVEVDINNPYTKVIPSTYKMAEGLEAKDYKVQIMSQQAAYAEANGYGNVVAAMNIALSWYDSSYYVQHPELVGEPLGYLILDGEVYKNSQGQTSGAQTCLVINFDEKDGEARPADMPKTQIRSTKDAITGWEEQVIPANFGFLVKNGVNQYPANHTSDPASRSFMGIKADGSIIIVMNDGRQSPYSAGFNNYEMAEFMLSLGCVQAVNGDGGGSSAFLSQRPGEDLKVNCSPSDGAERETTHGILVISTAPATGEFNRANISSAEDYYTPGSSVQFTAVGTDLVGTAAEIPADAAWQLADTSVGSIDDNGLFVSNGTVGDVIVQMVYNGAVVGEDTIHIVNPDTLVFGQENMVVPYGKTVPLDLTATYDSKNVVLKISDVTFTLSENGIGTISGFDFTAAEEGTAVTAAVLTAEVSGLTATTNLSLGKGSEIVYDFEDQDLTGWSIFTNYGSYGPKGPNGNVKDENGNFWYHGQNERGYIRIVNSSTGMVKNGQYALAMECDFTQVFETGYQALNLTFPTIDCTDSIAIGFWLYVPYDARHAQLGIGAGGFDNGELFNLCEGWHYVTAQAKDNKFYYINISVDDRACSSTGNYYDYNTEANLNGKYTFYIDDITVDYSTAVDDRENPVFGQPVVLSTTGESSTVLSGQTINYNTVTFEVPVAENTAKTNAVGLDGNSAKAYIDGKLVACTFAGGKISAPNLVLADGVHTVRFEIADKNGNSAWAGGDINVQAGTDASTVKVVPQDPEADRILIGSLYWMDVVATDIETIDKVEMTFDMDNASSWELEGMTVAAGFAAEWDIQSDDNIAHITLTRTGKTSATGEAVLASFPVRTWVSTTNQYEGYEEMDPAWLVNYGCIWKKSIELELQRGVITYVEDYTSETTGTFGMEDLLLETEVFFTNYVRKNVAGAQAQKDAWIAAKTGWHEHTAEAIVDQKATCTQNGYTGRTYCAVCESVVDWGTVIPTVDHVYKPVDGMLVCECGAESDASGVVISGEKAYYAVAGKLVGGWIMIEDDWYYFDKTTYEGLEGEQAADGHIKFVFDKGRVTEGVWETTDAGIRYWYGPRYHRDTTNAVNGAMPFEIDGKTYLFNKQGYMQTGVAYFWSSNGTVYYDCGDDGVATLLSGPYNNFFYIEGIQVDTYKLIKYEGDYYYVSDGRKLAMNTRVYLNKVLEGTGLPAGYYEFDADGKMILETEKPDEEVKHGVIDGYLYINGEKQLAYQLVEFEGNFYYVSDGNKLAANTRVYLNKAVEGKTFSDGTPIQKGYYEFDAEGKMILKNGPIDGFFYKNGVKQLAYQLVEFEGNFYYISDGHKLARNTTLYLNKALEGFTYADGTPMQKGNYEFDAEGRMTLKNGPVDGFFYKNGVKQLAYQLVEFEGNFYYISDGHKLARNTTLYLNKALEGFTYADGTPLQKGNYEFDDQGRMILKNGPINGFFYKNGVKQLAYQLVEFEGNYYYISDGHKLAANTRLYLNKVLEGTGLATGYYEFDADGKMIIE